ncbi:hypothetical protein K438DRAFT_1485665, partial [Mycena galopus ATCC 62051]
FASVYDVFERNAETLDSGASGVETSKTLMRQMINSMAAKMEIGSPMASMYLLGNPDHYKSHQYVNFSWRPFAVFVKRHWDIQHGLEVSDDLDDYVTLQNREGEFVPSSPVDDYRYRPLAYESCTLYQWIQASEKRPRTRTELPSDWDTDDEDAVVVKKMKKTKKQYKNIQHDFLPAHKAAHRSHTVHCDFRKLKFMIPNFLGGALPRADKGDREFYCLTM